MAKLRKTVEVDPVTGLKASIDNISAGRIDIDFPHHNIHEQNTFTAWVFGDIGNNEVIQIAIKPSNTNERFHLIYGFDVLQDGIFRIRRNIIITSGGTDFIPRNRDHEGADGGSNQLCKTGFTGSSPIIYTGGTGLDIRWEQQFSAGKNQPVQERNIIENLFQRDVITLLEITSEGANQRVWMTTLWYEHIDSS